MEGFRHSVMTEYFRKRGKQRFLQNSSFSDKDKRFQCGKEEKPKWHLLYLLFGSIEISLLFEYMTYWYISCLSMNIK